MVVVEGGGADRQRRYAFGACWERVAIAEAGTLQQPMVLSSSVGVALTDERVVHITVAETKRETALQQQPHR